MVKFYTVLCKGWKFVFVLLLLTGIMRSSHAQELVVNGGAELLPVVDGATWVDAGGTNFGFDSRFPNYGYWYLPKTNNYFGNGTPAVGGGNYFFSAGSDSNAIFSGTAEIDQSIDLSAYTGADYTYTFTYYTATNGSADAAEVQVYFFDNMSNVMGYVSGGPYDNTFTASDPSDSVWHPVTYVQSVGAVDNVQNVEIHLLGNHLNPGASIHTFFDEVSLTAVATLPLTLLNFYAAQRTDGTVNLLWQTAQEQNSHFIEIQRSGDGKTFKPIGQVAAAGNSTQERNYSYIDESPLSGDNFYRLKMVDLDNSFKYSKVLKVNSSAAAKTLEVFSNPFHDQIGLRLNAVVADQLVLTLTDLQGRICLQQAYSSQAGNNFINLYPPASTAAGVYLLTVRGASINQTIKVLKQ